MSKYFKVVLALLITLFLFSMSRARADVVKIIRNSAKAYNIKPDVLLGICWVESNHIINVINRNDPSGAYGVCQVLKSTAEDIVGQSLSAYTLLDPTVNSLLAAKYLRMKLDRYNNDVIKAIAAYNAGSARYKKNGDLINIKYVNKVLKAIRTRPWDRRAK